MLIYWRTTYDNLLVYPIVHVWANGELIVMVVQWKAVQIIFTEGIRLIREMVSGKELLYPTLIWIVGRKA